MVKAAGSTHKPPSEKRYHTRHGTAFSATHSGRHGFFVDGVISNLSRSGLCLHTQEEVIVGEKIEVFLHFESGEELALQAQVVHRDRVYKLEDDQRQEWFQAGLYMTFVEAEQKPLFERLLTHLATQTGDGVPIPDRSTAQPRIRIGLDGPERTKQFQQLEHLPERGLFIEIAQPLSVLDRPRVRLVNPLTQAVCELTGEVTQTQVLSDRQSATQPGSRILYSVFVTFSEVTPQVRAAIGEILSSVSAVDTPRLTTARN